MSLRESMCSALRLDSEVVSDPNKRLAVEIVIGAANDWRRLIKSRAWLDENPDKWCNFDELRKFFKGDWCAFLLQDFRIEPARILEILEEELQQAMQQPVKEKRKGGKRGRIY